MKKILYFLLLFLWTKPIGAQSCRVSDSLQLIALYQGIHPVWNLTQPVRNWSGITLNAAGAVISINLGGRSLSGNLPLLNLPDLEDLLLHDNQLIGNIPNFNLPKLRRLFLYLNQLSGSIPNFNLPELDHLHLHANRLTGEIPLFERLTKLRKLELPHNLLTGKVPPFNFPIIQHLDIGANRLSGTVPVLNCPMMEHLYLEINELSGAVPVFNCPMQRLLLGTCRWTFGDMQPVYNAFRNRIVEYAPQDSIFKDTTILARASMPFAVSLGIDNAITSNQYQWFKNNVPFGNPTQTNQLIINNLQISDEGIYTCKVTNPNMPLLTLNSRKIKLIAQTSPTVEANVCETFKIFPNPTSDRIQIDCGGKLGETIKVYNEIGQLMTTQLATQEPIQLDLSAFQSGVYLVRWGDKTHKILKIN